MRKDRWSRAVSLLLALGISGFLVFPGEGADLGRGRRIYNMLCRTCHGNEGRGDGPRAKGLEKRPRDFTEPGFLDRRSDAELKKVILEGRGQMPAFRKKLRKEKYIRDVIAYIRHLATKGGK